MEACLRRLSSTGKAKAKFEKYQARSEVFTYTPEADNTLNVGKKRKIEEISEVKQEEEEVAQEEAEETETAQPEKKKKKKNKNKAAVAEPEEAPVKKKKKKHDVDAE